MAKNVGIVKFKDGRLSYELKKFSLKPARQVVKKKSIKTLGYFPVDIGYEWVFQEDDNEQLFRVEKKEKMGEIEYFVIKSPSISEEAKMLVFISAGGIELRGKEAEDTTLLLPNPLVEGESWKMEEEFLFRSKITVKFTYVGKEKTTVPIGTYDCLKIKLDFIFEEETKDTSFLYFAPGIGLIKMYDPKNKKSIMELKKFSKKTKDKK